MKKIAAALAAFLEKLAAFFAGYLARQKIEQLDDAKASADIHKALADSRKAYSGLSHEQRLKRLRDRTKK